MESFLSPEGPADSHAALSANTRRNRVRIARACDQCSEARTRCNGNAPCGRCLDIHLRCRYDREVKKRGRRSNASKAIQRRFLTKDDSKKSTSLPDEASTTRNSSWKETDVHQHPPASCSVELRPAPARSRGNDLLENSREAGHSPSLNTAGVSTASRHAPLVNSLNFVSLCRYPCLEPLLPALENIIPVEEACDLLDIYFVEPGNSLFSIHSPYVLTPVLRKKSLLSPTHPRPTSPALLSTMLWCMAHTANICAFRVPGSRERIINKLLSLSLSLFHQRDMDNWHRVPGGWRFDRDCTGALAAGFDSGMTWTTFTKKPQPTVDDVLTLTLLTTVISGGEFKFDSVKWWDKAGLCGLESSLNPFPLLPGAPTPGTDHMAFEDDGNTLFSPTQGSSDFDTTTQSDVRSENISTETHTALALTYARYILHVLHVLLHGEWDAISMLEDEGNWIASSSFPECASQAIAAAHAVSEILEIDPELSFMPYLFGIYLFHGSFVLLLFADRMPQVGPNASVEQACEVIIRAHEVCVVTLSTEFQVFL
ncbi:Xylanolytic transcriptional activator xlnR [Talaromyces islandicus]|uniref:Xylanolytic transcriptional activator xlnR n=1 Tax=Talaromyces islandicus TaxID=28573 RepID=A0A0U1LND1_TALIS|nr:Xylanolytic transcriptional activator xlnR [Talaromyces islandicus]